MLTSASYKCRKHSENNQAWLNSNWKTEQWYMREMQINTGGACDLISWISWITITAYYERTTAKFWKQKHMVWHVMSSPVEKRI